MRSPTASCPAALMVEQAESKVEMMADRADSMPLKSTLALTPREEDGLVAGPDLGGTRGYGVDDDGEVG